VDVVRDENDERKESELLKADYWPENSIVKRFNRIAALGSYGPARVNTYRHD